MFNPNGKNGQNNLALLLKSQFFFAVVPQIENNLGLNPQNGLGITPQNSLGIDPNVT